MANYTNEHLEFWGEVYRADPVLQRAVPFDRFIADPWKYMHAPRDAAAPQGEHRPLLPRQLAAANKAARQDAERYIQRSAPRYAPPRHISAPATVH